MDKESKNKIRLATVFSGIGAIEHALDRMSLNSEIVFACDNGDIDVFSTEIDSNILPITKEIDCLQDIISKLSLKSNKDEFENLICDLSVCQENLNELKQALKFDDSDTMIQSVISVLHQIVKAPLLPKNKKKLYDNYLVLLSDDNSENLVFNATRCISDILTEYTRDNPLDTLYESLFPTELVSGFGVDWQNCHSNMKVSYRIFKRIDGKQIIENVENIVEKLKSIHRQIMVLSVKDDLLKHETYKDKKRHIDELYLNSRQQNRVRESYMANHSIADEDYHWDATFLDGHQYTNQVDVFVGGSPCQSFSMAGKRRGLDDTRGTLFYEFARLVDEIKPKVFIYENVKGVLFNDNGRTWKTMQRVFDELDYEWYMESLNSKNYGVPQQRERIFVVGFRNDIKLEKPFVFPTPVPLKKTLQDILIDNTLEQYYKSNGVTDVVTNNKPIDETVNFLDKYFISEKLKQHVLSYGSGGFHARPDVDLRVARPLLKTMHKMHRASIGNYVTTNGRLRTITPRECLRLMGFCDSFKIVVSDTAMYQQAGNAIVVDVLIAIMYKIIESCPGIIS